MATQTVEVTEFAGTSNDAKAWYEIEQPYTVAVTIQGVCPIIFHRWSCEVVEAKAKAAKGSKAKKTDDTESYLWRNDDGLLCLPTEYVRQSIINAAKFRQDPRSPRKSAMDLFKAAIANLSELNPFVGDIRTPNYIDRRRVVVQRNGLTRERPAFKAGWSCTIEFLVNLPEYVSPPTLNEMIGYAGRIIGVGEMRPSYGRYVTTKFEVLNM